MWFKRIIYGLLGVRNREDLTKDLKGLNFFKIISLFLILNITFISIIILITRYFL